MTPSTPLTPPLTPLVAWLLAAVTLIVPASAAAQASPASGAQLAADKGCYNCHGNPSKKKTPTFATLAKDYAQYQGQPDKAEALASKLRAGSFFGQVDAHERLGAEDALALVRWIISGSPPP